MSAPITATRAAHQLSEEEITARYIKRVRPLVEAHGAGSPIVAAVQARYGRMLEDRQASHDLEATDMTALAASLGVLRTT